MAAEARVKYLSVALTWAGDAFQEHENGSWTEVLAGCVRVEDCSVAVGKAS